MRLKRLGGSQTRKESMRRMLISALPGFWGALPACLSGGRRHLGLLRKFVDGCPNRRSRRSELTRSAASDKEDCVEGLLPLLTLNPRPIEVTLRPEMVSRMSSTTA